jgi:hypothetical protein
MNRTITAMTLGAVCTFLIACDSDADTESSMLQDAATNAALVADGGTPSVDTTIPDAAIGMTVPTASNVDAAVAVIPPAPSPPAPRKAFGEMCSAGRDCSSGICEVESGCTRLCDINKPNPCRAEKAFCVPVVENQEFVCAGMIDTGNDLDDAIVLTGDRVQRLLTPLRDADMFTVNLVRSEPVAVTVFPAAGIDVALDGYNLWGELIGTSNVAVGGGVESITLSTGSTQDWAFMVVRNVGNSTGSYHFSVEKQR